MNTHLAFLDLSKAFDMVSHQTIRRAMVRAGVPGPMVNMIMVSYGRATTSLTFKGVSQSVQVRRGVRQGDPLSATLFNLVLDECVELVRRYPVGINLQEARIPMLAYADDLVLLASSPVGLQFITDRVVCVLGSAGLKVNPGKCKTLSVICDSKKKQNVVDPRAFLKIDDAVCQALAAENAYRYLGLYFGGNGIRPGWRERGVGWLREIKRAPMKPQQRMHTLCAYLIPKLTHELVLGRVHKTELARFDTDIRVAVKTWLKLPRDTSNAFLYASCRQGGLGVPCLSIQVPLAKQARLAKLCRSSDPAVRAAYASDTCRADLRYWGGPVKYGAIMIRDQNEATDFFGRKLYDSVDGAGLLTASQFPRGNTFLSRDAGWISGSDYIKALKVRSGTLQTPARRARGQHSGYDSMCSSCGCSATLAHMSQSCPRGHGMRVKRHDNLVDYVAKVLRGRGWTVLLEPTIPYLTTYLKPDLVLWKTNSKAHVLDLQVVADGFDMVGAHSRKVNKYDNAEVRAAVCQLSSRPFGTVGSITLNWRGMWFGPSARQLQELGFSLGNLNVLSLRALVWTHNLVCAWNKSSVGRGYYDRSVISARSAIEL